MTTVVFLGPTLAVEEARAILDVTYLPPVGCGDIYRAVMAGANTLGIVDGYFHFRPSVRHKEIAWALSRGVRVFGAASMGALRAAEMGDAGMCGVGKIFRSFSAGDLEDDDEVAVAHMEAEYGFRPITDAMVNIRATMEAAVASSVVSASTAELIVQIAKRQHYLDRILHSAIARARSENAPAHEIDGLCAWLPSGSIDLKRQDAEQLLRTMSEKPENVPSPRGVNRFVRTEWWDRLVEEISMETAAGEPDSAVQALLLDHQGLTRNRSRALLRHVLLLESRRRLRPEEIPIGETLSIFLAERNLNTPTALRAWMSANELDAAGFQRLLTDEARLKGVLPGLRRESDMYLADELRLEGEYVSYLEEPSSRSANE